MASPCAAAGAGARSGPAPACRSRRAYRGHVWTYDIVYDAVSSGRTLKVLTVVDEFTRVALAVHGAHSITARTVKGVLAELFERHGAPAVMRSDNGGEFVASEVVDWLEETRHGHLPHRSRQALAERLRRVVQRPPARRVPERARVLEPEARPRAARTLPDRVQQRAPAQLARLHDAQRVRRSAPRRRCLKTTTLRCHQAETLTLLLVPEKGAPQMQYHQITSGERYAIAALRRQGLLVAGHRPRPGQGALDDLPRGGAEPPQPTAATAPSPPASARAARRRRSRRGSHFGAAGVGAGRAAASTSTGARSRSPAGCARHELLAISYETIYLYVWRDKRAGGELWRHMRQAGKQRRKRYGAYDSRGRLAGKRHISERPAEVEARSVVGHWEIDTVKGDEPGAAQRGHPGRARDRLPRGRQARAPQRRRGDARARIELIGRHAGRVAHRDRRQRHRVPQLRRDRGGDRRALLLRDPAPLLGAGHEREHERPRCASTCPSARAWRTSRRPTATRSPRS